MKKLGTVVACVAAATLTLPAAAAAIPKNVTPPRIVLTKPEVGITDLCNAGNWQDGSGGTQVQVVHRNWLHSDDLSTSLFDGRRYTPARGDIGKQLVCQITEKDLTDGTTATAASAPTSAVVPLASVTATRFSPDISGDIGESLAGVGITLSLVRSGVTIGSATTTSGADGTWSATLAPVHPASGPAHGFLRGDQLAVGYTPPTSSPGAVIPLNLTYGSPRFAPARISSDGTTISSSIGQSMRSSGPCPMLRFIVDGTPEVPTNAGSGCSFTATSPLSDQDHVQAALTQTVGFAPAAGQLKTINDVGLLGERSSPTCTADLVTGIVACFNLNAGRFALSMNGNAPVALSSKSEGDGSYSGQATVPGLKIGAVLTLDETSPTATTRHLVALHLLRLRVKERENKLTNVVCQPDEFFDGQLCPANGATQVGGTTFRLLDDQGGGHLKVTVPTLSNMIPADQATVPQSFTAFADLGGMQTPAQAFAATKTVRLTVRPHGHSTIVFQQDMNLTLDSDGPYASVPVSGLSAGLYYATWLLTDVHGDTSAYQTEFAVGS